MMFFLEPEPFSSAFGNLVYGIQTDSEMPTDIHVMNTRSGNMLGVKRVSGSTIYKINIAPYLRGMFDPQPLSDGLLAFRVLDSRLALSHLIVGGKSNIYGGVTGGVACSYLKSVGSAAGVKADIPKILSSRPGSLYIRPGDSDEISFIVATAQTCGAEIKVFGREGSVVNVSKSANVSSGGIVSFNLAMGGLSRALENLGWNLDDVGYLETKITCGQVTVHSCRHHLDRNNSDGVRLSWVNPYGAVDSFTFYGRPSMDVKVDKKRIYGEGGLQITSGARETYYYVTSGQQCEAVMKWLSEIIYSPHVWMIVDGVPVAVDIVTDNLEMPSSGPAELMLRFRLAKHTEINA